MQLSASERRELHAALLDSFDRDGLWSALKLGTNRDLEEISLAPNKGTLFLEVIVAAENNGWISELVIAAQTASPSAPALTGFIKKYPHVLNPSSNITRSDPFQANFLRGLKRAFINRKVLRNVLRSMADKDGCRVLVVDGPSSSGKSYSLEFITYLSERIGTFRVAWIDFSEGQGDQIGPDELVRRIAVQIGRSVEGLPARHASETSWPSELCDWLVAQVSISRQVWWIVLDGIKQTKLPLSTVQAISGLALRAELLAPNIRVILLSCSTDILPPRIVARITRDDIGEIGKQEIQSFLEAIFSERAENIEAEAIAEIVEWVGNRAGLLEKQGLYSIAEAVENVAELLFQRAPVPGYTWTKALVAESLPRHSGVISPFADDTIPLDSELDVAYLRAAAVLSSFSTDALRPFGQHAVVDSASQSRLLYVSIKVNEEDTPDRWSLRNRPRRLALASLGTRQAMQAALAANLSRPEDAVQQMLEAYIGGSAPPIDTQDLAQLESTARVIEWLDGIITGLPELERVQRRLEFQTFLKPLRELIGNHFQGREMELRFLRGYVEDSYSETLQHPPLTNQLRLSGQSVSRPLLIYGPGGRGKSTLIAKYILERAVSGEQVNFPFSYVDFRQNHDINVLEPATLLVEVARQLGIQRPDLRSKAEDARSRWLGRLSSLSDSSSMKKSTHPSSVNTIHLAHTSHWWQIIDEFADLLHIATKGQSPLLLVLDTFEELQFGNSSTVSLMGQFLSELEALIPIVRTVILARTTMNEFPTEQMNLSEFDQGTALSYLEIRGIADTPLAQAIIRSVGGNPLNLKLAADLVAVQGLQGIEGLQVVNLDDPFFSRFPWTNDNIIREQLFQRIVGHIHDPDIRKLVYPSQVLRQITPETILEILAQPSGLRVSDIGRATELFEGLSHEVSLFINEDGKLRMRRDTRRLALDLLNRGEPTLTMEIHKLAVQHYVSKYGIRNRAEELYHRLQLQEDIVVIKERWLEGVESFLVDALDELPVGMRPFLGSMLGINVDRK